MSRPAPVQVPTTDDKGKVVTYTPKMKPGDVEIPNRVFVKGFSKDTIADELFSRFEEFGKVIDCRIVADRYGNSKGYGFITFDSQNIAEKVKEMERVRFNDDVELVVGPARIRKKRFYLLPGSSVWNPPQPCYFQDGNFILPANVPTQQVLHPAHMVSNVQMTPVIQPQQQQQPHAQQQPQQFPQPQQQQQVPYSGPLIFSVVNEPISVQHAQPSYVAYQASPVPANMTTMMEKMNISQVTSPVRSVDDQEVPNYTSAGMDAYGLQFQRVRSGTF